MNKSNSDNKMRECFISAQQKEDSYSISITAFDHCSQTLGEPGESSLESSQRTFGTSEFSMEISPRNFEHGEISFENSRRLKQ